MTPEPYYADEMVTLYLGDCRDVLPEIDAAAVALLLTDPPYGLDYKPLRGANGSKMWGDQTVRGDDERFTPAHLLRFPRLVLFGANFYADQLPASGGWIVWDKTPSGVREGFIYSHAELAWTNVAGSRVEKYALDWQGNSRNHEGFLHPTQKPVGLMRWIVEKYTRPGDLVLDPYMGSGPVLLACRDLGRRYIGIEIEEPFCATALRRYDQGRPRLRGGGLMSDWRMDAACRLADAALFDLAEEFEQIPETLHGSAFTWAAKQGLIEATGRMVRHRDPAVRHKISQWRSLTYGRRAS